MSHAAAHRIPQRRQLSSPAVGVIPPARSTSRLESQVIRAVRRSLNLPRLRVAARPGPERGCWQVCLSRGGRCSSWLTLPPSAVAVIRKVELLPPRLLGVFRLAYDALQHRPGLDSDLGALHPEFHSSHVSRRL